jgi:Uma2 family endonuclease
VLIKVNDATGAPVMTTSTLRKTRASEAPTTIDAFDAFVGEQPLHGPEYELVDGQIVQQANPTGTHEQIIGNLAVPLKQHMDPRGCQTFMGGMRVQRSDDRLEVDKTKPDIVVHCGLLPKGTFVTTPLIVVEVLSPSTMDIDRGPKLEFYKSLDTMMHIAVVYQDQMRTELDSRTPEGWERTILIRADDQLRFDAVDFHVDLASVYFGTELA